MLRVTIWSWAASCGPNTMLEAIRPTMKAKAQIYRTKGRTHRISLFAPRTWVFRMQMHRKVGRFFNPCTNDSNAMLLKSLNCTYETATLKAVHSANKREPRTVKCSSFQQDLQGQSVAVWPSLPVSSPIVLFLLFVSFTWKASN